MRKTLIALCAVVLLMYGCVTVPPSGAIGRSAIPVPIGEESVYTGFGQPGAHNWTDDDARTLLWLRSNLPNLVSDVPFPVIELFHYNQHNLIHPLIPATWSYYFADPNDPILEVRMMTLTARDRNRTREGLVIQEEAKQAAAAEQPVEVPVANLSDREVAKNLLVVYP